MTRRSPVGPRRRRTALLGLALAGVVALLGAALAADEPAPADRWERLLPAPAHGIVTALAAAPSAIEVIYAGTLDGRVWRSDDAGQTWVDPAAGALTSEVPVRALLVDPKRSDLVYRTPASGYPPTPVQVSRDGGRSWVRMPGGRAPLAVDPERPDTLYGSGWRSPDGGVTWQILEGVGTAAEAAWVHPVAGDTLLVGGERSTDGGRTWERVLFWGVHAFVAAPDEADVVYAATGAGVARSDDAGRTWSLLGTAAAIDLALAPDAPQHLYAITVGFGPRLLVHSGDGGRTWQDLSDVLASSVYAGDGPVQVEARSATHILVRTEIQADDEPFGVRGRGWLYESRDAGANWQRLGGGALERPEADQIEWGEGRGERVWYARSSAGLFRRTASEPVWTRLLRGATPPIDVGRSDADVVVLLPGIDRSGTTTQVQISRDGGRAWDTRDLPEPVHGRPVIAPGDADRIYLLAGTGVLGSRDGGRHWRQRGSRYLHDLHVSPHDGEVLFARPHDRPWLRSVDGGDHWEDAGADTLDGLLAAWSPHDADVAYVGWRQRNDRLYPDTDFLLQRTDDGGRTWRHVAGVAGYLDLQQDLVVHPSTADLLLAAGQEDVLLSRDGGRTWRGSAEEPVGDRMLRVLVDSREPQRLLAAGQRGLYELRLAAPLTPAQPPAAVASYDTTVAAGTWQHLPGAGQVRALALWRDGTLWFVAGGGTPYAVGTVRGDSVSWADIPDDVAAHTGPFLVPDPAGGLWCGTAYYDGAAWHDRYPVNADELTRVYTPRFAVLAVTEGQVWGRTADDGHGFDGGLVLFEGERAVRAEERFGAQTGNLGNTHYINVVAEGPAGDLWIGSGGHQAMSTAVAGGLTHIDGEGWRFIGLQEGLAHPFVRDIAFGPDGTLWAATDGGLTRLPPPYTAGIGYDEDNSALASPLVRAVDVDADGTVWLATQVGVTRYRDGVWTNYGRDTGMPGRGPVRDVLAGPDGRVWVATDDGLVRLTPTATATVHLPFSQDPGVDDEPKVPAVFSLGPSQPNPFGEATAVPYRLPRATRVELALYNVAGCRVRVLVDELRPAGAQSVDWDGTDDAGRPVASGVYLCQLRWPGGRRTRLVTLVR